MRRHKLDKIDKKILKELQADGRMTNVELARRVGISAPPCLRRVRALEDAGHIRSYHADINPAVMGYSVIVFATVKLNSQADGVLEGFEKLMESFPRVRECHLMTGDSDFILKIVAKDWDDYQELHKNHLTKAPNVVEVKSSLTIRTGKNEPGVPVSED